jgi:hypothetical protein
VVIQRREVVAHAILDPQRRGLCQVKQLRQRRRRRPEQLLVDAVAVLLAALPLETRRLYLVGEVLAVPDRVGAEVAPVTPATYRKRLERARRAVADAVRTPHAAAEDNDRLAGAAREFDDLERLGELHRAHTRGASADGAMRALRRVTPTLAA